MKKILFIIFTVTGINFGIRAQDFHFTQWDRLKLYYSPAETGNDEYKYSAQMMMRSQWRYFLSRPFATYFVSYDMPLKERWGVGGYVAKNEAAWGYNDYRVVASGSYLITNPGQKKHLLKTGLQAGFIHKNLSSLSTFDKQYQDGGFNSELPSGENIGSLTRWMPEFNWGIYYAFLSDDNKWNPSISFAVNHITAPNEAMIGSPSNLPRRFTTTISIPYVIDERNTVQAGVLGMWQGKHQEIMPGIMYQYKLNDPEIKLTGNAMYRINDSFIAGVGLIYKEFTYMFTYDVNVSPLKSYSRNRGALEFSITFKRKK